MQRDSLVGDPETVAKRTPKLVAAISGAQHVVDEAWLRACETANDFIDPTPYLLTGTVSGGKDDNQWSFDADRSRARAQGGKCFAGLSFLLTSSIKKGQLEKGMPAIISCAGGAVVKNEKAAPKGTIVVSVKDDEREFKALAKRGLVVVSAQHVMSCAMNQEFSRDDGRLE